MVDDIEGGFNVLILAHSHIKPTVVKKTETSFALVDLMRTHPQINENSVHFFGNKLRRIFKICLDKCHLVSELLKPFFACRKRLAVSVEAKEFAVVKAPCNLIGMSATAHCAVYVSSILLNVKRLNNFVF